MPAAPDESPVLHAESSCPFPPIPLIISIFRLAQTDYLSPSATRPAPAYLEVLATGLRESRGWDEDDVAAYLATVLPRA